MSQPELLDRTAAEYAIAWSYFLGAHHERERIAAGHAELDAATLAVGVDLYQHSVQERLDLFERHAAESSSTWRGTYPGGPVDFETGALAT